ncbi:hypothetical protein EB001_05065 [bacterium]|nr:hypothetical protein [bacterium]
MTNLGEFFKQTCNKPYTRHKYKLVYSNGQSVVFDSYEEVQMAWFDAPAEYLSHVDVIDRGGFK